jgi:hypothetical protein
MTTIHAGVDFFATEGHAYFPLPMGLGIPEHFFHKGSEPWTGLIQFEGHPFRKFKDPRTGKEYDTGEADTAVLRKQDVTIDKTPGSGKTEIQLVALSLRSCGPIKVRVGKTDQHWDAEVGVSAHTPSDGSMTITQTSERGGVFESEFRIVPEFRFVRQADGQRKVLDFGGVKIPQERQTLAARITTLQAAEVPWLVSHPADTLTIAGVTSNFAVARIAHHSHNVVAVQAFLQ